jgi:drug/metabolite transporter (DMT)-like permease
VPEVGALWPFALVGAAVPGLTTFLFQRAVREAGASRPTVVLGTAPLLSIAIAAVFLGEQLDAPIVAGTVLVVLGCVLVTRERTRPSSFTTLGLVLAGICAALFAARDNLVRAAARDVDVPSLHAGAASLVGAAAAVALYLLWKRGTGPAAAAKAIPPMLPAASCLVAAYLLLVAAYDAGPVTTVSPLVSTQPLWTVAIAAAVLGQSEHVGARLVVAASLVVAGGGLIGVAR